MNKPKLATLSVIAIALAAIVGGCATSQPAASDGNLANAPVSAPVSLAPAALPAAPEPTPQATPTPAPTQAPTAMPTPTPSATPAPLATPRPGTASTLVPLPKLTETIPGASKIAWFKVTGTAPSKIVDQIVIKSAKPCHSGTRDVLACVAWKGGGYRWTATTNPSTGSCTVTSLAIDKPLSIVHLPQLVSPAGIEPALLAWWKPVLDHFAWHEGRHIKIEQRFESRLRSLVVGHRCSAASGIIRRWEGNLAAAQHAFDVSDYSWQPEWSVLYAGSQG